MREHKKKIDTQRKSKEIGRIYPEKRDGIQGLKNAIKGCIGKGSKMRNRA
jgi:hypothetical protein